MKKLNKNLRKTMGEKEAHRDKEMFLKFDLMNF